MRNIEINQTRLAGAVLGLLFGMAAQSATANSEYDSASLNGNLQHQCTGFSAALDFGGSLSLSAECNKEGSGTGSVAASQQNTSFDLSDHVVWNTDSQTFTWDATRNDDNDITEKCTTVRGLSYSSSDVTLLLTCNIASTTGAPQSTNADLPLNGQLRVGADGNLERR